MPLPRWRPPRGMRFHAQTPAGARRAQSMMRRERGSSCAQRGSSTQTVRDSEAGDSEVRGRVQLETWLPSYSRKNVEKSFEIAVALILTMEAIPVMWSCLRVTPLRATRGVRLIATLPLCVERGVCCWSKRRCWFKSICTIITVMQMILPAGLISTCSFGRPRAKHANFT